MSEEPNNLKPVLVVPKDTPKEIIKAALAAGYIPVPCSSPGYVQLLVASNRYNGDDLLMASLESLQGNGPGSEYNRSECVKMLWRRIRDRKP